MRITDTSIRTQIYDDDSFDRDAHVFVDKQVAVVTIFRGACLDYHVDHPTLYTQCLIFAFIMRLRVAVRIVMFEELRVESCHSSEGGGSSSYNTSNR